MKDLRELNPEAQILVLSYNNPVPLMPSWSRHFRRLNTAAAKLGQLIKAAGETFRYYPYQFIIPCVCVSITMLCFNLIGDGLRDALDPKLRV